MKYMCKCKEFEVSKPTIQVIDYKVVVLESYCNDCKTYGKKIREHKGTIKQNKKLK